ncbi:uncharacterized protein LOC116965711 [Tyto alba]|uniref:uncharacterized protein LOC116965711 n=1 Tax=Tyto alba TaxID=56313 RepID=UPI001C67DA41|nr:uncharacterized protein LOC116965711 [Tyto alba]
MEPMFTAAALEAGPVYFFDQMKTRMKERGKMVSEELSSYFTTDLSPGFTPSPVEGRGAICTGECMERHEDGFLNDDTRKEKHPVLQQVTCHSLCKTTTEDSNPKISQTSLIPQADEDSPLNVLNESVAANMLQELGEKLQLLARYKTGFPQGPVNVLTCSWRELTEGLDYCTWHQKSLSYKSVRSRRSQASDKFESAVLGSKCIECEITAIRKECYKKSCALPACTTKEKRKSETASSMPLGSKGLVVQNDADQSSITISFSLSSSICEERGWIFQLSDSNSEDIHQKLPYVRTLERPEQIQKQIEQQTSKLKDVGFDKPIILRHYGDHKEETFSKTWKVQTGMTVTPELTYGKPQIPVVKKAGTTQRKLHYGLNDGSSFI